MHFAAQNNLSNRNIAAKWMRGFTGHIFEHPRYQIALHGSETFVASDRARLLLLWGLRVEVKKD